MLERLASGGIYPVIAVTLLAFGYARVFDASRRVYIGIWLLFGLTILGSQFLPEGNIFRTKISGNLVFIGRALIWITPVVAYAFIIRWVRKKTRSRKENNGT